MDEDNINTYTESTYKSKPPHLKYNVKPLDMDLLRKKLIKAKVLDQVTSMIMSSNDEKSTNSSSNSDLFSVLENTVKRKLTKKIRKPQANKDETSKTIAAWVEDVLHQYVRSCSISESEELSINSISRGTLLSNITSQTIQPAEDVIVEKVNEPFSVFAKGSKEIVKLTGEDGRIIEVHSAEVNGREATLVRKQNPGCTLHPEQKWSTWMIHVTNNPGEHLDPSAVNVLAHVTQSGNFTSDIQMNETIQGPNTSHLATNNLALVGSCPQKKSRLKFKTNQTIGREFIMVRPGERNTVKLSPSDLTLPMLTRQSQAVKKGRNPGKIEVPKTSPPDCIKPHIDLRRQKQ